MNDHSRFVLGEVEKRSAKCAKECRLFQCQKDTTQTNPLNVLCNRRQLLPWRSSWSLELVVICPWSRILTSLLPASIQFGHVLRVEKKFHAGFRRDLTHQHQFSPPFFLTSFANLEAGKEPRRSFLEMLWASITRRHAHVGR